MAQAITDFMWPVYLLTLVGHYSVLGAFSSVVMIVSSISVYGMGMVYDKRPLRHLFPAASLLVGVTWVLRFMALEPLTVLAADAGGRFLSPLWWMKIRRFGLNFGERINTLVFSVAYELLWTVGLMTGLFLGGMLVLMSGGVWAFVLVPAVGGVLLSAWAARNK
jgi:hypothetical protein